MWAFLILSSFLCIWIFYENIFSAGPSRKECVFLIWFLGLLSYSNFMVLIVCGCLAGSVVSWLRLWNRSTLLTLPVTAFLTPPCGTYSLAMLFHSLSSKVSLDPPPCHPRHLWISCICVLSNLRCPSIFTNKRQSISLFDFEEEDKIMSVMAVSPPDLSDTISINNYLAPISFRTQESNFFDPLQHLTNNLFFFLSPPLID